MFEEGALVLGARETLADELAFESDALLDAKAIIVLAEPSLPLLVHHQNKLNHPYNAIRMVVSLRTRAFSVCHDCEELTLLNSNKLINN